MMVDSTESNDLRHFEDMLVTRLSFLFSVLAPVSLWGMNLTLSMHLSFELVNGIRGKLLVGMVPAFCELQWIVWLVYQRRNFWLRRSTSMQGDCKEDPGNIMRSQWSHNEITMSMKNRGVEKDLASWHSQTHNSDRTSSITIQSIESLKVFRLPILFAHSQSHNDFWSSGIFMEGSKPQIRGRDWLRTCRDFMVTPPDSLTATLVDFSTARFFV